MNRTKILKAMILMGGLLLLPLLGSYAEAGAMSTPEYWQAAQTSSRHDGNVAMTSAEIQTINASIRQRTSSLRNLSSFPTQLRSQQVQQRI